MNLSGTKAKKMKKMGNIQNGYNRYKQYGCHFTSMLESEFHNWGNAEL